MKLCYLIVFCISILACAPKHNASSPKFPPDNCQSIYVLLPGNFVIDLAAESEIILDPAWHEFIVYCTPQDAIQALKHAYKDKQIPEESDWRVYVLNEQIEEIGTPCHEDDLCLQKPATVKDWL